MPTGLDADLIEDIHIATTLISGGNIGGMPIEGFQQILVDLAIPDDLIQNIIDEYGRAVDFGSTLAGKTITLKYLSDGWGTDEEMIVHKFAEEAVYKWIAYGILSCRSNIPEQIIFRFKREKFAETRKAKIRLSNIKIEEFTQVLKGMGKQIK